MRTLGVALLALLLALTYLVVQGATPDAAQHERTLDALRALDLNNAALQRDVLRSRTGLLRTYDLLVHSGGGAAAGGGQPEDRRRHRRRRHPHRPRPGRGPADRRGR